MIAKMPRLPKSSAGHSDARSEARDRLGLIQTSLEQTERKRSLGLKRLRLVQTAIPTEADGSLSLPLSRRGCFTLAG